MQDVENKGKVLRHFEIFTGTFNGVYEGKQESLLYKLVDVLFRKKILQRRMEIVISSIGDLKDKKVLDIGCGPGQYALALTRGHPKSVLGIDISPSMIEFARERAKAACLERICRFENLDFLDKSFHGEFDIVIAAGVFDYVCQPQLFLSKIQNVLKGRAVISFPIKWTLMTPIRMAWLSKRNCPHYYYTKREIKRLLDVCGLKNISIRRIGTFMVPGNYVVVCEHGGN